MFSICLISGQHAKEFRDFLSKFPEEFVIKEEEDIIYLKEYENQIRHQLQEGLQNQLSIAGGLATRTAGGSASDGAKIDPRATAKILSFVREELEKCLNVTSEIEQIFKRTDAHFQAMQDAGKDDGLIFPFKRSQDLDTFLKMHSHLFRVQSGSVTLVPIRNHYSTVPAVGNKPGSPTMKNSSSNEELGPGMSNTKLSTSPPPSMGSSANNNNSLLNKTLKQRVNSVVLKALADNSDRERRGAFRGEELNNNSNSNKVNDKYSHYIAPSLTY